MRKSSRIVQSVTAIALLMLGASIAQADTFAYYNSAGAFVPNDIATWNNINGVAATPPTGENLIPSGTDTTITSPIAPLFTANSVVITTSPGNNPPYPQLIQNCNSCGWTSGSMPPQPAWLVTTHSAGGNDQLILTFATAISAFGAYIQDQSYTTQFNAQLTTNNGASATFASLNNGNAMYIGVQDTSAGPSNTFTVVTLTVPSGAAGVDIGYFAIGPADLIDGPVGPSGPGTGTNSTTPEPASFLLVAGGMAFLGWKARKRSRA
jgi:hypothetical protein